MLLLEHTEYLCLYEAVDFVFHCRAKERVYDISTCRLDVVRLNEVVDVVLLFLAGVFLAGALVKRNYRDGCTEELVIVFIFGEEYLGVRSDCDFLHVKLAREYGSISSVILCSASAKLSASTAYASVVILFSLPFGRS